LLRANRGAAAILSGAAAQESPDAFDLLQSPNASSRSAGQKQILNDRTQTVKRLIAIIDSPRQPKDDAWLVAETTRNSAIHCIAEYRATEAIPSLMKHLEPQPGEQVETTMMVTECPALRALIAIGRPAVAPVLQALKESADYSWTARQCRDALYSIEGFDQAKQLLQRAISKETNPKERARLQSHLDIFDLEFTKDPNE